MNKVGQLTVSLPVTDCRTISVPGIDGAKLSVCYVKVGDMPAELENYMEINPRVPSRTSKGILSGPITKGILETLREKPEQMALKNQGIYLLADTADFNRGGTPNKLTLSFKDVGRHGIINGGHTYAAIRESIETATPNELEALQQAYVKLHVFQGIDEDFVPEIAEGLNRSRQVDDPSLSNLQGEFDVIRRALREIPGSKNVAYHQGDAGDIYITEILVYLELFNLSRFSERKHPNALYNRAALGLKYFSEDMAQHRRLMDALIKRLPDFLWLADTLRKLTPAAAKHNQFRFGRAKVGTARAGSEAHKGTLLPFLGETVDYRVPNGWVFPMLAAFRANLRWDESAKQLEWSIPLERLVPDVIDDLVGVCVVEHRDNNVRPEIIGKRESAYAQCYVKMQLHLARKGLLR